MRHWRSYWSAGLKWATVETSGSFLKRLVLSCTAQFADIGCAHWVTFDCWPLSALLMAHLWSGQLNVFYADVRNIRLSFRVYKYKWVYMCLVDVSNALFKQCLNQAEHFFADGGFELAYLNNYFYEINRYTWMWSMTQM